MTQLNYLNNTIFEHGALGRVGGVVKKLSMTRPFLVTDRGVRAAGLLDRLVENLPGIDVVVFDATPENPTEDAVLSALDLYRASDCDGVVCLGGGSPMDLGKAVALLARSGGDLERYDPVKGGSRNIGEVAPVIAIPTTAGTGSEVSLGFVITMRSSRKVTFASPLLIPKVAICDPDLTLGLPAHLTAATGMDAITHCIEALLSPVVNPPADGIALDGLRRGWANIARATADGADRQARWNMMMASTEGAFAFVKGLGAVHSMSHAAGRLPGLKLHHGALNAVLLPAVLTYNRCDATAEQYGRMADAMGLDDPADLPAAIANMNKRLGLPAGLSAMGVSTSMIDGMLDYAVTDLATRTNPVAVTADSYRHLFEASM